MTFGEEHWVAGAATGPARQSRLQPGNEFSVETFNLPFQCNVSFENAPFGKRPLRFRTTILLGAVLWYCSYADQGQIWHESSKRILTGKENRSFEKIPLSQTD